MVYKSVCFTGHRPTKLGGYDEMNDTAMFVKKQLELIIVSGDKQGCEEFITGGALGVDTWAAELVILLCSDDTELTVAVPCTRQDAMWLPLVKQRYRNILEYSDRIALVPLIRKMGYDTYVTHDVLKQHEKPNSFPYSAPRMMDRNSWMVDHADMVVAVWDGTSGGTGNCVNYALQQGKAIYLIDPIKRTRGWLRK